MLGSGVLIEFVVVIIIAALVWWLLDYMKAPQILRVVAIVVFVLWLIIALVRGPLLFG